MSLNEIHIEVFSSGYCTADVSHIFPDEPSADIPFHATWAFITHPFLGKILFDTGYSLRFHESTRLFPNRMYRWITPVFHKSEESCLNQLLRMKINPDDIGNIVISHFHADHIGGLKDFPHSAIWCSEEALLYVQRKNRFTSVFKGLLKSQIPGDISKRAFFPEKKLVISEMAGLTLWKWHDGIYFVNLPGHFRGQLGLYLKGTNYGDLLLCADAAWAIKAIHQKIYPSKRVSFISDDYLELTRTIDKLHNLHIAYPDITILPAHCHETMNLVRR
jgi:glyoxylase-like metal-dependent hydrolase (beta-lactamase superfamily II)